ncbi:MAG: hypothetical protein IJG52_00160 [Lachnospiraceae bacterium]|nr:hypothetical protein [Lachnospiraceae bacterium]
MQNSEEILKEFYSETDPAKREALLAEYRAAASGDGPVASYVDKLFVHRFPGAGKNVGEADRGLKFLMDLLFFSRSSTFFKKRRRKDIAAVIREMEQDERVHKDPAFEEAFLRELRNMVKRYIVTCGSDSYGRKFLGMVSSSKEEKLERLCSDLWELSGGLAEEYGLEQEMALLCRAVNDEYLAAVPEAESLRKEYEIIHNRRM